MVALDVVHASNARLRELGPGLVALFGTRGPEHVHHPAKCTSPKSHNSLSLNNYKMINEEDIKAALAEIETSEDPNYRNIARKFKLIYITLLQHVKSFTRSRADFQSKIN
jgi:hypothetical protein